MTPDSKSGGHEAPECLTTIASLRAALVERDAHIAAQERQIGALKEQVASLSAQVQALTEIVNRNSKNSHLPPSSDGPGASGAAPGNKRNKSGRKAGGQKGHRGSWREMSPSEAVDTAIDLFPEVCLTCAHQLPQQSCGMTPLHQQIELRDGRRHLTELRRHAVRCAHCGALTQAAYEREQIPSSAFGPCLTATVALLTGGYHLSRRKAQRLLKELLGISVSLGAVSTMERRASEALKGAYAEALGAVQKAGVKHTDATSWLRSGKLMSLWTLASKAATVYQIVADGCRDTILPMFGARLGFLVSDRATVLTFWMMAMRQICHAHLLRKFVSFSEREGPGGCIGRELLALAGLVFDYWHGFQSGMLTRDELKQWMLPIQRQFERVLVRGAKSDIVRLSGSCADILAHREALWTFVEHPGIEPTNNHAERELRDFVLWRKRSFGSRSERGERFAERVMTAVRTAHKQGKDVLEFLVHSIAAYASGAASPRLLGEAAVG